MDVEWALGEIAACRDVLEQMARMMTMGYKDPVMYLPASQETRVLRDEYERCNVSVSAIAKAVDCERRWRSASGVQMHLSALVEIETRLQRQGEIAERIGPTGPSLQVGEMHPWVWSVASTFWQSGQYRVAVSEAAEALNKHLQAKVGRFDLSGADLARQAYSNEAPKSGAPRLRPSDAAPGTESYKSRLNGTRDFAAGSFTLIRNMATHDVDVDWSETEAAEALAALSVLARRINSDDVEPGE